MRQINFLAFFALCLLLVLFSLQNADPTEVELIPGFQVEAPLSVELLGAMGSGAVLAWLFGLWGGVQTALARLRDRGELRKREKRIQALEEEVAQFRLELNQKQLAAAENSPAPQEMQAEIQDAEFEPRSPEESKEAKDESGASKSDASKSESEASS